MIKKITLLIFILLTTPFLSAQCVWPNIMNTEEEKNVAIQLHNLNNIIHKPFLNINNKSDVLGLIDSKKLPNAIQHLDSIEPFVLKSAKEYIGTQKKRDSLRKRLKEIDDYNNKITELISNRLKEDLKAYNQNKAEIHSLIEIRVKRNIKVKNERIKKLETRFNHYSEDEKKFTDAIKKLKQLQLLDNESNDFNNFLKYDRTLVYLYTKRFRAVIDKNKKQVYPFFSVINYYIQPKLNEIVNTSDLKVNSKELITLLSNSANKKRETENWRRLIKLCFSIFKL